MNPCSHESFKSKLNYCFLYILYLQTSPQGIRSQKMETSSRSSCTRGKATSSYGAIFSQKLSLRLLLLLLPPLLLLLNVAVAQRESAGRASVLSMLRCKQVDVAKNLSSGYGCFCHARFRHAEPQDELDLCCMMAHCCARAAILDYCQSESGLQTLEAKLKEQPSCKTHRPAASRKADERSEATLTRDAVVEVLEAVTEELNEMTVKEKQRVEREANTTCERVLYECERALYMCASDAPVRPDLVGLPQQTRAAAAAGPVQEGAGPHLHLIVAQDATSVRTTIERDPRRIIPQRWGLLEPSATPRILPLRSSGTLGRPAPCDPPPPSPTCDA
ncbi:uncharacterized protein LOC133349205 isoform X3 [Lethenteron reissneri]|uniref:uncharacterized protein LOC133349205 isoform X3 n=1 Tax=Lethenteron reissneri TaxID=7753 RepID=UPI002AB5F15C|nr:uncharacterized protein LOC133349205 isoform X3 [Lethenteron reissneri]